MRDVKRSPAPGQMQRTAATREMRRWPAPRRMACWLAFLLGAAGAQEAPAAESAGSVIRAAGDTADDFVRLAHLRELAQPGDMRLDAATRGELTDLLAVATAWAEGRTKAAEEVARGRGESHRYLHNFFNDATQPFDPPFPAAPRVESLLYPLWAYYRGRFLTWFMLEHSEVSQVPARKNLFLTEAERCFARAQQAFPHNPVLKIYAGENQPAPNLSREDPGAPAWANHQRRALEQLHQIIRWWIAERQLANGEFGGKWGDDIEMWRWWAPVLIGFDDPMVNAAQERLARGNLSRPGMAAGYTHQLTDVEHTSEETADTLTPMLHVAGEDPSWSKRVQRILELADRVWWGENARGRLQFKHIDFNDERVGPDAARAYDTGYHVRVMQPALLLWQRTGDPSLGRPLTRWLRTWAEAALGTDNGKPAGIVPAALHWPSGRVGSVERGWIGPELAGDPMVLLYSWPGYPVAAMTDSLLQAHLATGEATFLDPLLRMARMRRAHLAAGDLDGPPGTAAWSAHRLPRVINDALAKWRQVSGDRQFDDLLLADANGYVRFLVQGQVALLTPELAATAATLSVNWPMFTSEVRYTDRVLAFPREWPRAIASGLQRVDTQLLYSTVTGDPGAVENFPLNGARWHTLPRDIAVLVAANSRERFTADLYHFGQDARPLEVSLLTLEPGSYTWNLADADGGTLARGNLMLQPGSRRLQLELPARVSCRLEVKLKP